MVNGDAESSPLDKVQEMVEMLLLKKNLGKDPYLRSAINPQMYIGVATLAAHEKLRELNATEDLVIEAAKRSHRLGFDEKTCMVRPMLKSKRNTLILREIPEEMKEADVMAIFEKEGSPKLPVKLTQEVNQTWFAKFETDENLAETAMWVRSQKLHGRPIQCAMKSEYFLRSFFPLTQHSLVPSIVPFDPQAGTNGSYPPRFDSDAIAFQPQAPPHPVLNTHPTTGSLATVESPISTEDMPPIQGSWRIWGVDRPPLVLPQDDDDVLQSDYKTTGGRGYSNNWWESKNQWNKSQNNWNETRWSGKQSKGKGQWPAAKGKGKAPKGDDNVAAPPPPPWTWDSAPKWASSASQSNQWSDGGKKIKAGPKWQPKANLVSESRKENRKVGNGECEGMGSPSSGICITEQEFPPLAPRLSAVSHSNSLPTRKEDQESREGKQECAVMEDGGASPEKGKFAYSKEELLKIESVVVNTNNPDTSQQEADAGKERHDLFSTIPRIPPFPT